MEPHKIVDAMNLRIQSESVDRSGSVSSPASLTFATWISVSAADPNLSIIKFQGAPVTKDYIPKCAGCAALVSGDTVLMIRSGSVPWTILDKVVGNTTLFPGLGMM